MSTTKVTAIGKTKDKEGNITGDNKGELDYNFGENLKEAVKLFGEDVVFNNFRQAAIIAMQGTMRRHLAAGKTQEELVEAMKDWKPGQVSRVKKTPAEKVQDLLKGLSPDEVAETLKLAGLA